MLQGRERIAAIRSVAFRGGTGQTWPGEGQEDARQRPVYGRGRIRATDCRREVRASRRGGRNLHGSTQERDRERRGVAREATPGHRAQEHARRHRPGQAEIEAGAGSAHACGVETGESGKRCSVPGKIMRDHPPEFRGTAFRQQAHLERFAAKSRPGRLRRGSGQPWGSGRRATMRTTIGIRLRSCGGKACQRRICADHAPAAAGCHQPRQAKSERDNRQPESPTPKPWQNPHASVIQPSSRNLCKTILGPIGFRVFKRVPARAPCRCQSPPAAWP